MHTCHRARTSLFIPRSEHHTHIKPTPIPPPPNAARNSCDRPPDHLQMQESLHTASHLPAQELLRPPCETFIWRARARTQTSSKPRNHYIRPPTCQLRNSCGRLAKPLLWHGAAAAPSKSSLLRLPNAGISTYGLALLLPVPPLPGPELLPVPLLPGQELLRPPCETFILMLPGV